MFKFIAELDHGAALVTVFPLQGRFQQGCEFLKASGFLVTCMRGAESLSVLVYVLPKRAPESLPGFSLKHAALVLTNGPSWFLGKILLTLSSLHLTVEWVIHFARL